MRTKPILLIIAFLVLINQSYALGIAPSYVDVTFEPGLERTVQLKLTNNENKNFEAIVFAEGPLEDYITINNPRVRLQKGEDHKMISYTVKLPQSIEKQGMHETRIVAREIPDEKAKETTVTSSFAVASRLRVNVPYSGKYSEIRLFVPNFRKGQESNFAVEAVNLGTDDIVEAYAVVNIFDQFSNRVASITTESVQISSKEKVILIAKWVPDVQPGNYRATATLIYDGLNTRDEKSFRIGEIEILIDSISVKNFILGQIARFDILIENKWSEQISNVFAETSVKDSKGKIYSTFRTASEDIPAFGIAELASYWDTDKVAPGSYVFDIALNYLGMKTHKEFDIFVGHNEITTSPIGRVISPEEKETSEVMKAIYILTFLVVILIAFNIFIYIKKIRK